VTAPVVQLVSFTGNREGWGADFDGYAGEIVAETDADVLAALAQLEEATARGLHAAGFICYETAHALNPALPVPSRRDPALPLLWFGLYRQKLAPPEPERLLATVEECGTGQWQTSLTADAYAGQIARIHYYIRQGHSYQVNFTLRRTFSFSGTPEALFAGLCRSQLPAYGAFIRHPRFTVLSASPELFFRLAGDELTVRPMKGTAPRGATPAEDDALAATLAANPKERAENLMIVDLLRNDLGMVARTGSVVASDLFRVEGLPTLQQMTSTVKARLLQGMGLQQVLAALFPCGSVTGAPKRRTMEIIDELEEGPRGIYTGCIGWLSPGPAACFSVAIRTVLLQDPATGRGTMGVGSGITIDAQAGPEYGECLAKSDFARFPLPHFRLVETLLHRQGEGFPRLQRHLDRLTASAARFGFRCQRQELAEQLQAFAAPLPGLRKVRLLLARDGSVALEEAEIQLDPEGMVLRLGIYPVPVDSRDPLLYHKTDYRPLYRQALQDHPHWDDVLFVNERGELTEGSSHTLVLRLGGRLLTPPLSCGLLPGVLRGELLQQGTVTESQLTPAHLALAEEVWLVNSVRGWRRAELSPPSPPCGETKDKEAP
jgi:para-aminobenzoate synthetase/4-amino-4-deoxychorismate lyase